MNEEQKNIETCLAENILSEVASVPTDPQFRSLTDEALDPLKQQALQQAGYDGYKEVVMYHQPYTFTSQVKQMKSNLILLLRRLWRYPFGRGTTASSAAGLSSASAGSSASAAGSSATSSAAPIRSLADMWQHYITRLKGNPEYGIPSRLSSLTDLPDAPALLADRDMSSGIRFGETPLPDGMSLAQLISDYTGVTKLIDDNSGWVYAASFSKSLFEDRLTKVFPNLSYVELGCSRNSSPIFLQNDQLTKIVFRELVTMDYEPFWMNDYNGGFNNLTEIEFPKLETGCALVGWNLSGWWNNGLMGVSRITFPKMKRIKNGQITVSRTALFSGKCPAITELEFPELTTMDASMWGGNTLPSLVSLKMPKLTHCNVQFMQGSTGGTPYYGSSADLIDIEVGELQTNFDIRGWNPTNVLAEADKTATFLSNFKTYIAERLTDKGSGLTLTLSQEVRNAIHAAEYEYGIENIIITQKGWTISPAPN